MKEIIKSQFVTDVNETKMTRKELAAKYELPEVKIKDILKAWKLKISKKQHETYVLVDDTAIPADIVPESTTPFTEAFSTPVLQDATSESQVN